MEYFFFLYRFRVILVCQKNICTNTSKCECMLGVGGVKSYTIVSDIQNAAGDIICRKNNRATGYLEEKQ